jgi:hypothetical protein
VELNAIGACLYLNKAKVKMSTILLGDIPCKNAYLLVVGAYFANVL